MAESKAMKYITTVHIGMTFMFTCVCYLEAHNLTLFTFVYTHAIQLRAPLNQSARLL